LQLAGQLLNINKRHFLNELCTPQDQPPGQDMGHITHHLSFIECVHSGFRLQDSTQQYNSSASADIQALPVRKPIVRSRSSTTYLNILYPLGCARRVMQVTGQQKSDSASTALPRSQDDRRPYFSLLSW
jgi:hypothetical protein